MSRIFIAEQRELRRRVVIKVLPPELAAEINTERFRREIQLAANLQHPHIVPLFAAGSADHLLYYTMPFVKGESLRERLAREGELPVADAVRILRDVVDALAYAHAEGVVHRDIKPANVLLSGGHALVADFGVAKALSDAVGGSTLTSAGVALGTPMYMAPEQAVADPHADHRVDIYAVGALAYEMLTGLPPFAGAPPQQVLVAQVTASPEPILKRRTAIPPSLAATVMRCLEKRAADRWQTAEELLHQIEPLVTPSGGTAPHPAISESSALQPADFEPTTPFAAATPTVAPKSRRPLRQWVLIIAAVLLAFAAGYAVMRRRAAASASAGTAAPKSLVVLPFENLGAPADGYFADGITEEITSRLAAVPGLKVTSRTTAMQYKDAKKSVREIGQELEAAYVLEGSVRWEKAGGQNRIRVTPQLIRVSDDSHVWADRYDAVLAEVFDVQSTIAEKVVGALGVALGEPAKQEITSRPTDNSAAYDYYLRARETWSRGDEESDVRNTVQALERAVGLDSSFTAAWALLSMSHAFIYWQHWDSSPQRLELARAAMDRAQALKPDAPETRLARGYYRYWGFRDYPAALEEFTAALRSRPNDADIIEAIGLIERRQGRWTQALRTQRHAGELEPRSTDIALQGAETACMMRRFADCNEIADRMIRIAPEQASGYFFRSLVILQSRDAAAALRVLHEGLERSDRQHLLAFAWPQFVWLGTPEDRAALAALPVAAFGSDTVEYYASQGEARLALNDSARARVFFDSMRASSARRVRRYPTDDAAHSALGIAYARLGRRADAVREGRRAVELLPLSRDAFEGANRLDQLALIYAIVGDPDATLEQLRRLVTIPTRITPGELRLDPIWGRLRNDPRFQQLVSQTLPTDSQ